jgi:ubiquinol-cytochrome c reductase cytochrome b subunit
LYKLFYTNSKKKVIPENIGELLTPLALAVWIMDDGTWKQPGVRIATNCFTKEECELLVSVLDLKFNLKCSRSAAQATPWSHNFISPGLHKNKNNYQIYIKQESISSLRKLVVPHMVPSMLYKLGL